MRPRQPPDDLREQPDDVDATLTALENLVAAADEMAALTMLVREHAGQIRACRKQGLPYREIVQHEGRPLIAEALTGPIARFEAAGTRFRQAKAAALRAEGMTLDEIGTHFGLTRQRISGLLREAASGPPSATR